jgi:Protein of unknown function (DUF2505)
VQFCAEHRFGGTPDAVAAVLADRTFYEELQLPDLSLDAVVDEARGRRGERVLVLRYEYTGNLDPMARRLLGGERLTWTQEVRLDPGGDGEGAAVVGELAFRAEAQPALLHGDARFSLRADRGATIRGLEGELVVALPVVGRMAEQRIVPGVLARLDAEAAAVERRLSRTGAG